MWKYTKLTKIVSLSDTHGFHHHVNVPDGDILLHAGDLTMSGEIDVLKDVNEWFGKLPHSYKIVIAGNHDISLGKAHILGSKIFTNAYYLLNNTVEVEGIKIWGSPYTPWNSEVYNYFAFGKPRYDMKGAWKGMTKNADILLTHCPPKGILDKVAETGFNPNEHVGDELLLAKIERNKPKYNIFGHIHEGYGILKKNDTTFINCSVVDEHYNLVNEPVVINL